MKYEHTQFKSNLIALSRSETWLFYRKEEKEKAKTELIIFDF